MTAVELKTCELCGRLFVRNKKPAQRWDTATKGWVNMPLQRDCAGCLKNPPKEEDEPTVFRSFRVVGVKI